MIITRTPFRFTLGGGGTDLPSYYTLNGGLVISMAIDKYMYITLKPDYFDNLCKLKYSEIENVNNVSMLKHSRAREALILHNIKNGLEITSCADLSANSGLGSSGTFLVGLLKSIREYKRINIEPEVVADEACHIEIDVLKEPVGKQDQYIASYGGVRIFNIAKDGKVTTTNLNINCNDMNDFLRNVHVYSLNIKRNASDILQDQQKMIGNTEYLLNTIKEYGYKTIDILQNKNYDEYGILLDDYWKLKKQLSSKISLNFVDEIYEEVRNNYNVLGGKIIGAGGGGFLMLYINQNHDKLEKFMKNLGMWRLPYSVDYTGSRVIGNFLENKL
jgi:D-glycero-alpha-D-manno-heptose-7-phosphate kinase